MRAVKLLITAAIAATAAFTVSATAQNFPDKPVTIIMPYPTGTGPDTVQRLVNEKLQSYWGQPVTIENRPGANYWAAVEAFKKAAPDGYTLFQTENWMLALQPHIFKKLPYDPAKDLVPVAPMYQANFFLVVPADSPWKTVADLVAAAKAKEGALSYGSSGRRQRHAHGRRQAGRRDRDQDDPCAGQGDARRSSRRSRTEKSPWPSVRRPPLGRCCGRARSGILASPTTKRNPDFPDVPTLAEVGGPADFVHKSWLALYARPGTPKAHDRQDQCRREPRSQRTRRAGEAGWPWASPPYTGTPEELAKAVAEETESDGRDSQEPEQSRSTREGWSLLPDGRGQPPLPRIRSPALDILVVRCPRSPVGDRRPTSPTVKRKDGQWARVIRSPKDFWLWASSTCCSARPGSGSRATIRSAPARGWVRDTSRRSFRACCSSLASSRSGVPSSSTASRSASSAGRRWLLIIGSAVFAFAVLIEHAGLIVAGLALLFLCATASEQFRFSWTRDARRARVGRVLHAALHQRARPPDAGRGTVAESHRACPRLAARERYRPWKCCRISG